MELKKNIRSDTKIDFNENVWKGITYKKLYMAATAY